MKKIEEIAAKMLAAAFLLLIAFLFFIYPTFASWAGGLLFIAAGLVALKELVIPKKIENKE